MSLLEAVLGLAIVGMTAIGVLGAVAADLRVTERSRRALEAAALATARLDALNFLTDYELLALPDSMAKGVFEAPLDAYRWQATAATREDVQGVYDVTVTIEWDGGMHTVRSALYRRPLVVTQ